MKSNLKMAALATVVMLLGLFSGCATNTVKPIPPAQILAIACPPTLAAITQFAALDASLPNDPVATRAAATLTKIQPVVAAACSAGANVSIADVQSFAQTVLPALGQIAGSLPIKPAQLTQIEAGLTAAQIAVGAIGVVEQQIKAAQVAPAPAATAASIQ